MTAPRLRSLDALRGLTMGAMVLVNNPGSWSAVYPPLLHAKWHGCTFTDLVFPFFLFIVGAAMAFSSRTIATQGSWLQRWGPVLRRAAILFALGLFLNGFPFYDLSSIRVPGVLQRIALCYLLAIVIVRVAAKFSRPILVQACAALGLLVVHAGLLALGLRGWPTDWLGVGPAMNAADVKPALVHGAGYLSSVENTSRWLDLLAIGKAHLWSGAATDPEGLLGTLSATVSTLAGYWTGLWVKREAQAAAGTVARRVLLVGAIALGLGWAMNLAMPWNKALWTPSYAVFTAGWALVTLAALHAIQGRNARAAGWVLGPLETMGVNAIALFVASGVIGRVLTLIKVHDLTLKAWIVERLFGFWLKPIDASLAFALLNVAAWFGVLWVMQRRGWQIRV
ncbi:MAG: heparan-alpha-glucosaminide N-acetyltransferase domain-containing protein [Planctomycetota bacterium]|nr:heparan-alpha-glucosaminide N-acetyltransferase domain-containing protein [Planctomycetota bacterium]